ncbi:lipocalin family protein [Flavobacterium psychraquaticum]|uniref:lipocalin family protein n=1 Tax=Flavobacterium psychraquaticum TaxID=3103958 RepID=UPI002ACEE26D|nr:lipocalin family protein [Flavobacterium sp. LB-N7T]
MKKIVLFLVFSLLVSCKQSITEADLQNLNGYWEIEKVMLPDGEKKEYKINETVDFFKVEDKKGFRKKVMPQVDGTYLTNDSEEDITIFVKDGDATIRYKTNYANWDESIIKLTAEKLVLKNKQELEYHYKRPVPFTVK